MCSRTKRPSIQDQPVAGGRRSRPGTRMRLVIMLGLLRVNNRMPRLKQPAGSDAIIDDRRTRGRRHCGGARGGISTAAVR